MGQNKQCDSSGLSRDLRLWQHPRSIKHAVAEDSICTWKLHCFKSYHSIEQSVPVLNYFSRDLFTVSGGGAAWIGKDSSALGTDCS